MTLDKKRRELEQTALQLDDQAKAGAIVPVDPEDAEQLGAAEDPALSGSDAEDSRFDNEGED